MQDSERVPDYVTCQNGLTPRQRADRGYGGAICGTIVVLTADGTPVFCPRCGSRVA